MAADVPAMRRLWEERWLVLACELVKMAVLCQSVGSSSQARFLKKLENPDMFCWLSSPVAEATDGGLKCLKVIISGLQDPVCWSSTTRKEVGDLLDCCCCPLVATLLC